MTPPPHLRYTWDHEWMAVVDGTVTVGITAFSAHALGDVVELRLPAVGTRLEAGQPCGRLTSPTAARDLYAPATGEVLEVNAELADLPGTVNVVPYGAGWLFRVRAENITGSLSAASYAAYCDLTRQGSTS